MAKYTNNTEENMIFFERKLLHGKIAVLGIPVELGMDKNGASLGPNCLRKRGLRNILAKTGLEVKDLKNIKCPSRKEVEVGDQKARYLTGITKVSKKTAAIVEREIISGSKFLALGGDHCMSLGTIYGALRATKGDLGVVWFDAHGDLDTPQTTNTGYFYGQVSAALLGFGHPQMVNTTPPQRLKKENILYVGLKDLDPGEVKLLLQERLNFVTNFDLLRRGPRILEKKFRDLSKRVKNIWISFDVDVLDREYAPATFLSSSGGLNYREVMTMAKYIGRTANVLGIDIAEFTPRYDIKNKTAGLILELIPAFLGSEHSDYTRYLEKYKFN